MRVNERKHHSVEFQGDSERRREPKLPGIAVGGLECRAEGCMQPKCCSGLDVQTNEMSPYNDPSAAVSFDGSIMVVKENATIWYQHDYAEEEENFSL